MINKAVLSRYKFDAVRSGFIWKSKNAQLIGPACFGPYTNRYKAALSTISRLFLITEFSELGCHSRIASGQLFDSQVLSLIIG